MGLKILHSADWHMDTPFASFTEDQREQLRLAQQQIPGKLSRACRENRCDLMLLAGDIFDGPYSPESLDLVRDALEDCGVPVLVTPGNHDPWGADSPWEERWPGNVCIFPPRLSKLDLPRLGCRVYGAGFASMDCPSLLEGFQAEQAMEYTIGVFHGDPTGGNSHYNPITSAQIRNSGLQYLALGHIHTLGGLEIGDTVCSWPGCPMGRGWDETGDKGYLIAELGDSVRLQPVALDTPRFIQRTVDVGEDPRETLERILPPASRDFLKITLTGYGDLDPEALRRSFPALPNLELRDRTVSPLDMWDQAGEDTLRGVYFQRLKDAAQQAEPQQRQRVLLAAEISRMLLEGREVPLP